MEVRALFISDLFEQTHGKLEFILSDDEGRLLSRYILSARFRGPRPVG